MERIANAHSFIYERRFINEYYLMGVAATCSKVRSSAFCNKKKKFITHVLTMIVFNLRLWHLPSDHNIYKVTIIYISDTSIHYA